MRPSRWSLPLREALLQNMGKQGRIQDFFRRGCTCLLPYFNTNKPHSFFFFCRIPVVLENHGSSQGRVRTPCTLPLDPPLGRVPSLAWNWSNCFDLFSPLCWVITTRSNRMKFRLSLVWISKHFVSHFEEELMLPSVCYCYTCTCPPWPSRVWHLCCPMWLFQGYVACWNSRLCLKGTLTCVQQRNWVRPLFDSW